MFDSDVFAIDWSSALLNNKARESLLAVIRVTAAKTVWILANGKAGLSSITNLISIRALSTIFTFTTFTIGDITSSFLALRVLVDFKTGLTENANIIRASQTVTYSTGGLNTRLTILSQNSSRTIATDQTNRSVASKTVRPVEILAALTSIDDPCSIKTLDVIFADEGAVLPVQWGTDYAETVVHDLGRSADIVGIINAFVVYKVIVTTTRWTVAFNSISFLTVSSPSDHNEKNHRCHLHPHLMVGLYI